MCKFQQVWTKVAEIQFNSCPRTTGSEILSTMLRRWSRLSVAEALVIASVCC